MSQGTEEPEVRSSEQGDPAGAGPENHRRTLQERIVDRLALTGRRRVITRIIVALTFVAGLTIINPSFFGWGLTVGAMIVAVPVSRLRSYAVAFLPYGAAWLIFTMLRAYADETSIPLRTDAVTGVERGMFFGTTPTIWLQNLMYDPLQLAWYDYFWTFIHWSYFILPHLAAIIIWRKSHQLYQRYLLTVSLVLGIGLLIYFVAPAAPPWLTADTAPQDDIYRVMANVGREINTSLYDRTYSVVGDSNPVAAMPSMHQAVTFVVTLFALRAGGWVAIAGGLYGLAMAFSLVYSGEHYFIDVLVGCAIATYSYFIAGRWFTLIAPLFRAVTRRDRPPVRQPASTASG